MFFFFTWRTHWIVASRTNRAYFRRSDLLPSRIIGNNKTVSKYSKFHIGSKFSRNCSSFSKNRPPTSYQLVERSERERCSRRNDTHWYLIQRIRAPFSTPHYFRCLHPLKKLFQNVLQGDVTSYQISV